MKTELELQIEAVEAEEKSLLESPKDELPIEDAPLEEENPVEETPVEPEAPKEEPKPEPDHAAIARANYEAREAKRKAAELEAELNAIKNPPKNIPAKENDWEGHTEGRIETVEQRLERLESEKRVERELSAASREFLSYEAEAKKTIPDYEEASNYLSSLLDKDIMREFPNIDAETFQRVKQVRILEKGKFAVNQGINPAHYIYAEASLKGYKSKPVEPVKTENKSNLSIVADNRKKTAGMAATTSSGTARKTLQDVDNMTNAERMKLSEADWDALEA